MSAERTWASLRVGAEGALEQSGVATTTRQAAMEARWIVERAAGSKLGELTGGVPARVAAQVAEMVERRVAGEPLQYVLAEWSFRGLDVYVDPRVLIPRPETEITAHVAIRVAQRSDRGRNGRMTTRPQGHLGRTSAHSFAGGEIRSRVADLGTGSGVIALALAVEVPDAEIWATDVSADALVVARANLASIGSAATRVRLAEGDWFDALPDDLRGRLRVVVANPPYVSDDEFGQLAGEVRDYEPRLALVSGPTGLEAIERIVSEALDWLEPGGTLVVEIAPHQAERARAIAQRVGFAEIEMERDLSDRERVLSARLAS